MEGIKNTREAIEAAWEIGSYVCMHRKYLHQERLICLIDELMDGLQAGLELEIISRAKHTEAAHA